jgi:hypothetical protein
MTPKRLGVGDSGTIGGPGPLLLVAGPPVVGAIVGAVVAPKARLLGGLIGFAAGIVTTQVVIAIVAARSDALMNAAPIAVTALKNPGSPYLVSSTTGGDVVAQATTAGFHVDGSQPHGVGPIQALWSGANGATVPAGLSVKQSAALAAQ